MENQETKQPQEVQLAGVKSSALLAEIEKLKCVLERIKDEDIETYMRTGKYLLEQELRKKIQESLLTANDPPMAECPTCGELVECEITDNGIGQVWHMVHCGWGHDSIYPVNR